MGSRAWARLGLIGPLAAHRGAAAIPRREFCACRVPRWKKQKGAAERGASSRMWRTSRVKPRALGRWSEKILGFSELGGRLCLNSTFALSTRVQRGRVCAASRDWLARWEFALLLGFAQFVPVCLDEFGVLDVALSLGGGQIPCLEIDLRRLTSHPDASQACVGCRIPVKALG